MVEQDPGGDQASAWTRTSIEAEVSGREKHLYSIYQKMQDKTLAFAKVLDIYGFRVIVKDVPACYLALGALHSLYKPIPGKFKDYIAIPKANGYQSLHTTLFGPFGTPDRGADPHRRKCTRSPKAAWPRTGCTRAPTRSLNELQQKTHQWLQSLLEMQSESGDSVEFLEHLKVDLFPDEVYVFTPKGKIMALPRGATAVDFAYSVHTDIGNRCVAAKVNHELVPLRTELNNGDRVEIITARARQAQSRLAELRGHRQGAPQIRHFLKTMQYEESAQLGERLLAQALSALGVTSQDRPRRRLGPGAQGHRRQVQAGGPGRYRPGQASWPS